MKSDIDYLISLMERYTIKEPKKELGEQDAASTGGGGKKNDVTTWSKIVGAKLTRGPANPISNEPRPDRVKRDGPANQLK
jgi:hypothetical protein